MSDEHDPPYVLFVGRVNWKKGLDRLGLVGHRPLLADPLAAGLGVGVRTTAYPRVKVARYALPA